MCEKLDAIMNKLDKTITWTDKINPIETKTWKIYETTTWYRPTIYAHTYGSVANSDLEKMCNKTFQSEQEARDCLELFISTHWRSEWVSLSISVDKDYSREKFLDLVK